MSIQEPSFAEGQKPNTLDYLRDLNARKAMLDGLYGAFLTGSLNAALAELELEWRGWWKNWQESPPHRVAKFERIAQVRPDKETAALGELAKDEFERRKKVLLPRRFIRHRVMNDITNLSVHTLLTSIPRHTKNNNGELEAIPMPGSDDVGLPPNSTRVRAFDTFIAAVAAQTARDFNNSFDVEPKDVPKEISQLDLGRRFYTVAAQRGLGKGTFLSVMSTRLGLTSYIRAAWPDGGVKSPLNSEKPERGCCWTVHPGFLSAVFINLSFSTEIASVYDMTIEVLIDHLALCQALEKCLSIDRWCQIGGIDDRASFFRLIECTLEISSTPKHTRREKLLNEAKRGN